MYPATYFGLFPAFPRRDAVFVAMSFDDPFKRRWTDVIEKGINNVRKNDKPLEAVRVDTGRISDSILTEILSGIGTARLVLADVTTIGHMGARSIRNANVMYEVGIAHAMRLPEEVLLFRSDKDPLLFDLANVRVNFYSPDESPDEARLLVSKSIIAALEEVDLRRHLAVGRAAESLDIPSWWLLMEAQSGKKIPHPEMKTVGQAVGNGPRATAIQRLLQLGVLRTVYLNVTPETFERLQDSTSETLLTYECTEFGRAVFEEGVRRILSPEIIPLLEERFQKSNPK